MGRFRRVKAWYLEVGSHGADPPGRAVLGIFDAPRLGDDLGITYLNGVQVDTRSASTLGSVDTTSGVFNIGQDPTGNYGETGEADIDDLGVWRRTLTAYDAYAIHYVGRTHGSSFDSATAPTLSIGIVEGKPQIAWDGAGTVEQADSILGPWTPVPGATSPYTVEPVGAGKFFRVKQ